MDGKAIEVIGREMNASLKAVVEKIATAEGFVNYSLEVSSGSGKGDNYLGMILRVRITGRRGGKDESMSLILKCLPENEERRKAIKMDDFYENEFLAYSEVIPAFERLQDEKGLSEEERFSGKAKWYANHKDGDDYALVLEDMAARGYRLGDRLAGLDKAHCCLVVKELGRYHALSFAMRDQRPEEFQRLSSRLKETLFSPDTLQKEGAMSHYRKMAESSETCLKKKLPQESAYVKRFREFRSDFIERMVNAVKGEAAEPYAVICHGDCWTNNYLFKYSEDGNTPEAVCLLDLQLSRYSSPITDIAYFLYSSTEGDVRRDLYKSLLRDYYESLSQSLRKLGSDPETLFPFSALEDQERRFSQFGLGMAVCVLPIVVAPAEEALDLDNIGEKDVGSDILEKRMSDERFLRRLSDVVVDMVDRNFI